MAVLTFEQYNMAPSPEQIKAIYDSGFQGVVFDRPSYYATRTALPRFYDAFPEAKGMGKGKASMPFKAALALEPEFGRYEAQTTGDCQQGSCGVTMANGTEKQIKDIQIGEFIISGEGKVRRVIDVIKKPYDGKMIRIRANGYPRHVDSTPDHKYYVFENNQIISKAIEDIKIGDYVIISNPIDETHTKDISFDLSNYIDEYVDDTIDFKKRRLNPAQKGKIRAKNSSKNINKIVKLDEKLCWLLGLYLAEGGIDGYDNKRSIRHNRITYNLGGHEAIIAEQVKQYFKEIFDIDAKVYKVPSKPNVIYVRISNIIIANLFKSLCPGNVYSKTISNIFYKIDRSKRLALLKGWFDGDGHYKKKGGSIATTVSEDLILHMWNIANSCGLKPKFKSKEKYIDKNNVNHVESYYISLDKSSTSTLISKTKVMTFSLSPNKLENGIAVKVISKEEVDCEDGFVYCINVDIDHNFIANGYKIKNCVSHGSRNAGMIDYCIDALFGETKYLGRFATENIYGARGHSGQGADCARLANYVSQSGAGGFLVRKKYQDGSNSVDLSTYNSSIGANWGRSGTPAWLNKIAAENKALRVYNVKTVEEFIDALAMGFGINMCSGYGFSSTRNEDGLSEQRGSWSHSMCHCGVDDTDWAHQKYGGPISLIVNSWGVFNSGPKRHDQPDGSFFIRPNVLKSMISGGGGFVIASVRGYNRELVYDMSSKVRELSES